MCSYIWRSLTKVWSMFRERITWSVGNGATVNYLGRLCSYVLRGKHIPLNGRILDFVDAHGVWNWALLTEFFARDERIMACPVPNEVLGADL